MEYKINFTLLAKNDLNNIQTYIYNNNKNSAKKVISYIIKQIELLSSTPSIGRAGRVLRTRELVINKYPFIIPYLVREKTVYILRILHTSQKWGN